ncbi:hypothetical protein VdG2_01486 [Verticillium dahliae VDG2]|nr:hypothetical protein VdG2_01486 [Verticillium dahliae VDG2]
MRRAMFPVALAGLAAAAPSPGLPLAINTWGGPFVAATDAAYASLLQGGAALDAVETGCSVCEANQCDGSVGYGGSPDEACETTLDAMIMDGVTMKAGAVAGLRRIKNAVGSGHDTISLTAISADGVMAAGTSTNGASFKVPGRVGDGPIVGSGSYVDNDVGACGATGDGDIMMRFLPCYQAVESMRNGMAPTEAAEDAVRRMVRKYPAVASGIVVVDKDGNHGAAASGWGGTFTYAYRGGSMNATVVVEVPNLCVGRLMSQP